MSAILKVRIPFYRRKTNGGTDGLATFYLGSQPTYLPTVNQVITITHTDVPPTSGLNTKLKNISTNTVTGTFQSYEQNVTQDSITQTDGYSNFFILQYSDLSFSTSQFGGDCRGYIEYDVNPSSYNVLKPIEASVIVSETVPFDLAEGIDNLTNKVTGATYPSYFLKGMFVKRNETNTIFANLLKSLNLPVSDNDIAKYTRTSLGTLTIATGSTYDTIIDGTKYVWTRWTTSGTTTTPLVVHPTTGFTGEYYGTALQPIGSYEFTPTNKAITPVLNELYLIFEIPNSTYGEIIDGKSVKFSLPYYTGTTSGIRNTAYGINTYGSTPQQLTLYGTYNKRNLNTVNLDRVLSEIDLSAQDIGIRPDLTNAVNYESNIVPLFCDTILPPQGNNLTTWSDGYADMLDGIRVFNPTAIEKPTYDYYLDDCVGYVALDKGFIVITHPKIVDSYFKKVFGGTINIDGTWDAASKTYDINGTLSTSLSRTHVKTNPAKMITTEDSSNKIYWDSSQFVFSGITGSASISTDLEFKSYNTEKSLNIVCLASSDEFFKSTNDTAKELIGADPGADLADFKSATTNLYPVIITSLGIHDANGNLLAICKPTQPVKKYWYDVVSFNVKIRL